MKNSKKSDSFSAVRTVVAVFAIGVLLLFSPDSAKAQSGVHVYPIPDPTKEYCDNLFITDATNMPTQFPNLPAGTNLSVTLPPGERAPASFVLSAFGSSLSGVGVQASNLTGPGGTIQASNIDLRLLKTWYQSEWPYGYLAAGYYLVPELLVKDDALILTDEVNQKGYLHATVGGVLQYVDITTPGSKVPSGATVQDATTLQSFSIPVNTNKQVWITVTAPPATIPGTYTGTITVSASGNTISTLTLSVNILPFTLALPLVEQSLYYRGVQTSNETALDSDDKTQTQLLADLTDMRDHGVLYPNVYQSISNTTNLNTRLSLMSQIGLPQDKIYELGDITDNPNIASIVTSWNSFASARGWGQVYFYGEDEAAGTQFESELSAWQTVHQNGGKVFVAVDNTNTFNESAMQQLDYPILFGQLAWNGAWPVPSPYNTYVPQLTTMGKKVGCYAFPFGGYANPDIERTFCGFLMLSQGYNGYMNYAYQTGGPASNGTDSWVDFQPGAVFNETFPIASPTPYSNGGALPTGLNLINQGEWACSGEVTTVTSPAISSSCYSMKLNASGNYVNAYFGPSSQNPGPNNQSTAYTTSAIDCSFAFNLGTSGAIYSTIMDSSGLGTHSPAFVWLGDLVQGKAYAGFAEGNFSLGSISYNTWYYIDMIMPANPNNTTNNQYTVKLFASDHVTLIGSHSGTFYEPILNNNYDLAQLVNYGGTSSVYVDNVLVAQPSVPAYGEANFMYTYPATNGPIDTCEWEAHREGINDIRYVSTLANLRGWTSAQAALYASSILTSNQAYDAEYPFNLDSARQQVITDIETALGTIAPIAWWKLDETSGTTASDSSGNNHAGTLEYGPTWTTAGAINGAILFNGQNDWVAIPDTVALKYQGGDMSFAFWVYPNTTEMDGGHIISKPWNDLGYYNYWIYYNSNQTVSVDLMVGNASTYQLTSTAAVTKGAWHQVVVTIGASGQSWSNNAVNIYVDGVLNTSGSHSISKWTPDQYGDSNYALVLGFAFPYVNPISPNTPDALDGKLDDVRIYNRCLGAGEVAALFNKAYMFEDTTGNGVAVTGTHDGITFPSSGGWITWNPGYGFTTRFATMASPGQTTATFTLPSGKMLKSIRVSGGTYGGTYSISSSGNTTRTGNIVTNNPTTVTTGWTVASPTVTVTFSSGQGSGIDSIAY